uniref:Facilitated trehalose transporter Tret1 n=1 Tax=Cacopsylla melanoneura TaxID=428564 RepID=A0A8D8S010_9HEMI
MTIMIISIMMTKWLRNKTADQVEKELGTIKENSSKPTERTNFKQFMGRANMRALMLSFFLILFRQFTGVQSLIAFANTVFASSVSFLSPDHITILFAVILLVSIFPATYFIDKSGRRILMLVSSGGCALSSFVAGIYYYLTIELAYEIPYTSWVPFVSLSLLGVFFNIGFGSLLTPLLSEFFASSVKAADMTVCGITGTTLGLASYKLFYYLNKDVGVYSNFIFGGVLCTISTVYLYVFLFETKGKTFNEIQMMFKYGEDWNDSKQSRDTSSASAVLNSNKEINDAENGGIPLTEIKC